MTYYCKLCDNSMINKSKYNHLKSVTHKILDESIKGRYLFFTTFFNESDEIMKRYINIYNKK